MYGKFRSFQPFQKEHFQDFFGLKLIKFINAAGTGRVEPAHGHLRQARRLVSVDHHQRVAAVAGCDTPCGCHLSPQPRTHVVPRCTPGHTLIYPCKTAR